MEAVILCHMGPLGVEIDSKAPNNTILHDNYLFICCFLFYFGNFLKFKTEMVLFLIILSWHQSVTHYVLVE